MKRFSALKITWINTKNSEASIREGGGRADKQSGFEVFLRRNVCSVRVILNYNFGWQSESEKSVSCNNKTR
jgi:hypothetical protein